MSGVNAEFSVIGLIMDSSGGVQFIMVVLFIASLLSWKLIFEYNDKIKKAEREFNLFNIKLNGDKKNNAKPINIIYNESKIIGNYGVFKVFIKSFRFLNDSSSIFNGQPRILGNDEKYNYEKELINVFEKNFRAEMEVAEQGLKGKINVLGTISSTSPYIGLLGTVYGILIAFWGLGLEQQATIATVAPSIAEALIATAMGLFVAIPSLIAYNRLNQRVDDLIDKYENVLNLSKLLLTKNIINNLRKNGI